MAIDDENLLDDEDGESKQEEKKGSSFPFVKILTYIGIGLGVVLISAITSLVILSLRPSDKPKVYQDYIKSAVSKPRDTYALKEFKLYLDKKEDESMATIVQVKLSLVYESGNQKILDEIIKRKEQIVDRVQYIISKKSYQEISTSVAREELLKKDLLYSLNSMMEAEILDIYFEQFIIQRIPG